MRKFIPVATAACLLLIGMAGLNGCRKIEDGLSTISWRINFDLVRTTWDIQLIDAATGRLAGGNGSAGAEITVTGQDAYYILDLAGIRQSLFHSVNGFAALALHPDRPAPEAEAPVRFFLHVNLPGYIPVTMPVLTYEEGINPVKVYLVGLASPPEAAAVVTYPEAIALAGGSSFEGWSGSTPDGQATVMVPSGTGFRDRQGTPPRGSLTVTVAHWRGGSSEGLRWLPGGQVAFDKLCKAGQIYLAGAVFADFRDPSGIRADTVLGSIDVTVGLDPTTYDPGSGSSVSGGQLIPVFYQDPATGTWSAYGTCPVTGSEGNLSAFFQASRPGLYAVGWVLNDLCPGSVTLKAASLPEYREIPGRFTVHLFETAGNELHYLRTLGIAGGETGEFRLRHLPAGREIIARFEPYTGEERPYYRNPDPLFLPAGCESGSSVEFDLLPKPNGSSRKIKVVFIDVTHNRTRYNPKVFPGYYRLTGTSEWQSAFVFNGDSWLVNPVPGATYEMGINFKGEFHSQEVVVGEEDPILVEIEIN